MLLREKKETYWIESSRLKRIRTHLFRDTSKMSLLSLLAKLSMYLLLRMD